MAAYTARLLGTAMQSGFEPNSPNIIRDALAYCIKNQNDDGSFKEVEYSKTPSQPEETAASRPIRFTAFVLVALLKNRAYLQNPYTNEIEKAFGYIENRFNYDSYGAAIAAYASVLANRTTYENYFDSLEKQSESDGEIRYWDIEKGKTSTSECTRVLIASYAAMAYIEANKLDTAKQIIRWLMQQRNPKGGFSDSHSTAVAMEALAMMAAKTGSGDTKIHFEIYNEENHKDEYDLTNLNALKPHLMIMQKGTRNVTIKAEGKGFGVVTTYFEYYKLVNEISRTFNLYVTPGVKSGDSAEIKVCLMRKLECKASDMVIMEFSLTSGYIYEAAKSNPMKYNKNIRVRFKFILILYLTKI